MTDEQEKIQAIADEKVLKDLSPKETSQVFDVIDTEALEKDFSTDAVPRKTFIKLIMKLALARDVNNFMPAVLEEPHPYKVLYDVVEMAENMYTNPNYKENGGIVHPVFLEILQIVKKDEKFKNDSRAMAKCIAIFMAYKQARYGAMLYLSDFQKLLEDDNLKLQLPKCIGFEYDKIVEGKKVYKPKPYDEEECRKNILENIEKAKERDKEIALRGPKTEEAR